MDWSARRYVELLHDLVELQIRAVGRYDVPWPTCSIRIVFKILVWLQCGCRCGWTIKRYARTDLRRFCRVSTTQQEHEGHGANAPLPHLTRRGCISDGCRKWAVELVLAGFSRDEILKRLRAWVEAEFADDTSVLGGRKVFISVVLHVLAKF